MMTYCTIYSHSSIAEYAWPGPQIHSLCEVCAASEFQHINRLPIEVELDPDGGTEFPDFIVYLKRVPLISERLRQTLDELGIDNLFYKPIKLVRRELGLGEPYWLALPPRIDCLDWENCSLKEAGWPDDPFWAKKWEITRITLDAEKIGHYRIFKLPPNTCNLEIVVTDGLRVALEARKFTNLNFYPLNPELA